MNATHPHPHKTDLTVTHVLAELLERLEHSAVPVGPEQYRSVVLHLLDELGDVEPGWRLAPCWIPIRRPPSCMKT
jgi:hypothetical protein